jgi:nitronate monooxygenase
VAQALFPERSLPVLQGWNAPGSLDVTAAWLRARGWALPRTEAFPDPAKVRARLQELAAELRGQARLGLDLRGLRDSADGIVEAAREAGVAFLLHTADLPSALDALRRASLPRIAAVASVEEGRRAAARGADALLARSEDVAALQSLGLPVVAEAESAAEAREAHHAGAACLRPRSPHALPDGAALAPGLARGMAAPLPRLRIRNLDLAYPIQQGGMGVGVSWEGLAGAVAAAGGVGLVSAIGTAYHSSARSPKRLGRPDGSSALNPPDVLKGILAEARRRSRGRGAVGVNILCAIEGYDEAVRASVEGGAQLIVSGAGLPLNLPALVGDADVALVPIVSSGRALGILCRQWQRKHGRLPDAVVLEGPESGGHQGLSAELCVDPAHSLENLLPDVLAERDRWGDFPVIVAGGVWDRGHIDRFLALGAAGVQMGTRFIGTFECDAHPAFKDTILKARAEDIVLMKSPVGLPARGVRTALQARLEAGTAPPVRCVSRCLQPCGQGRGAAAAGYCIADRLGDAWNGDVDSGLFFSGSNGARLKELVGVRDLMEELTQDPGLSRLAA